MSLSDEFAKKRARDGDDSSPMKKGAVLGDAYENETVLTSIQLEKKLEEQMNFGKEKDIRRYFEVRFA